MQQGPSKFAYVLLFLMTLFSMGGPFAIGRVLQGGEQRGWPPDRPVEWVTFIGITGLVIGLMVTILVYGLTYKRRLKQALAESKAKAGEPS